MGRVGKRVKLILYCIRVVLYTRGVFLNVLPSLEADKFIRGSKGLIARRGRPSIMYSETGSTFVAAAKWLKKIREDERFHAFLSNKSITWRFNVSRAPWWGGHFERLNRSNEVSVLQICGTRFF